MKQLRNILFITLLLMVVVFAIYVTKYSTIFSNYDNGEEKEGFNLMEWDTASIMKINNEKQFKVDIADISNFIRLLIEQLGIRSETVVVPPANPDFPAVNMGQCYSDANWRSIQARNGAQKRMVQRGSQEFEYNQCKAIAIRENATVFGLQFGNECWVGNTPLVAQAMTNTGGQIRSLPQSKCVRPGFAPGTGGAWSQMVYAKELPKTKRQLNTEQYSKLIDDLLDSGIRSYSDLVNSVRVNEHFTVREGMNEYPKKDSHSQYLDSSDIVRLGKDAKVGVNEQVINTFGDFKVERGDYSYLVANSNNKSDVRQYINQLTEHGFYSENDRRLFIGAINSLQSNYANTQNLSIVVMYLRTCGLTVPDIVDLKTRDPGPFVVNCKLNSIHQGKAGIPLFPPLSEGPASAESVMSNLAQINVNGQNMFDFFGAFREKGVTPSIYFQKIHKILTSDTFKYQYTDVESLRTFIQMVSITNNTVVDFERFGSAMVSLGINNYANYAAFISSMRSTVGVPFQIEQLMPRFRAYMDGPAYADNPAAKPTTIDYTTLLSFIDELNTGIDGKSYQFNSNSDFNLFLDKLFKNKYPISRIKEDIRAGKTYVSFMGQSYSGSQSINGFIGSIWGAVEGFVSSAKKHTEGMQSSAADDAVLNSFGITDFGDQLKKWETALGGREWTDMIQTTDKLTKLGLTVSDIDKFTELMNKFGATTVEEWIQVLRYLSKLGLRGYSQVAGFIQRIVQFGVRYKTSYSAFLQNLSVFVGTDLVSNINANAMNIANFYTFLDDMTYFKYNYGTNHQDVNRIMNYFGKHQIYLDAYTTGKNGVVPHIAVKSLYDYSSSAGSICPNQLRDFNLDVTHSVNPYGDKKIHAQILSSLKQITENRNKYPKYVLDICSYLFQEETYALKNATSCERFTADIKIQVFNDVAHAMMKDTKKGPDIQYRADLANMCMLFPCTMFEICMNEIQKSCSKNGCDYLLRSDPGNQLCRAATSRPDKTPRKIVMLNGKIVNMNRIVPRQTSNK